MKKWSLFLSFFACICLLTACASLENRFTLTGWYLETAQGHAMLITEDGEPLTLSDCSKEQVLFETLKNGDLIEITCDSIAETYPGQTGAYTCTRISEGAPEDIPSEPLTALAEMGYVFDFHQHTPAEEPLTVDDPVSGYCGNTVTEVIIAGESFSFWGSDSVALTDLLINLAYTPEEVCRCAVEYTVNTEFGSGYTVSLSQSFARCAAGQAALTAEQTASIRDILARNCGSIS